MQCTPETSVGLYVGTSSVVGETERYTENTWRLTRLFPVNYSNISTCRFTASDGSTVLSTGDVLTWLKLGAYQAMWNYNN